MIAKGNKEIRVIVRSAKESEVLCKVLESQGYRDGSTHSLRRLHEWVVCALGDNGRKLASWNFIPSEPGETYAATYGSTPGSLEFEEYMEQVRGYNDE
jgi:hypothetical protein